MRIDNARPLWHQFTNWRRDRRRKEMNRMPKNPTNTMFISTTLT
jgi:hypothetical protein